MRYWERPPEVDKEAFYRHSQTVCTLYQQAVALQEQGTHLVSTDEKTGIQAKERAHPTLPMKPGRIEYQDFEYHRHGTCCLIANFEVATNESVSPRVFFGPARFFRDARLCSQSKADRMVA